MYIFSKQPASMLKGIQIFLNAHFEGDLVWASHLVKDGTNFLNFPLKKCTGHADATFSQYGCNHYYDFQLVHVLCVCIPTGSFQSVV